MLSKCNGVNTQCASAAGFFKIQISNCNTHKLIDSNPWCV